MQIREEIFSSLPPLGTTNSGALQQRLSLFNTVISKLPAGLEEVHAPGMDVFSITEQVELERLFLPPTKKIVEDDKKRNQRFAPRSEWCSLPK